VDTFQEPESATGEAQTVPTYLPLTLSLRLSIFILDRQLHRGFVWDMRRRQAALPFLWKTAAMAKMKLRVIKEVIAMKKSGQITCGDFKALRRLVALTGIVGEWAKRRKSPSIPRYEWGDTKLLEEQWKHNFSGAGICRRRTEGNGSETCHRYQVARDNSDLAPALFNAFNSTINAPLTRTRDARPADSDDAGTFWSRPSPPLSFSQFSFPRLLGLAGLVDLLLRQPPSGQFAEGRAVLGMPAGHFGRSFYWNPAEDGSLGHLLDNYRHRDRGEQGTTTPPAAFGRLPSRAVPSRRACHGGDLFFASGMALGAGRGRVAIISSICRR
jgi:hypothetical protein